MDKDVTPSQPVPRPPEAKHYPDPAPIKLWSFMPLCGAEEGVDDNDSHPRLVCDAKGLPAEGQPDSVQTKSTTHKVR